MRNFYVLAKGLLILLAACHASEGEKTACKERGAVMALIDTAERSLMKAKQLFPPTCVAASKESECETKEKSLAYLEIAHKLISEVNEDIPSCAKCHDRPMDCSEVFENGHNQSGVYMIWPRSRFVGRKPLDVFCDMETDGGGWTVIQRRGDFSPQQDFYQDWHSYKAGFGNIKQDFWLGNDNIHALSNQGKCEVRFDLRDGTGGHAFAVYKSFWIDDESSNYILHVKNYSGNAGDAMQEHDGVGFSTWDRGNITVVEEKKGGWWYKSDSILSSNLNGIYNPGESKSESIVWWDWRKFVGLAASEIKIRLKEMKNEVIK